MGLRTIRLKLHNPGAAKRDIINNAFINYNNAYNYLLQRAYAEIDTIKEVYRSPGDTYSTIRLSKWVDRDISAYINRFNIQPFKDSLKLDFGMTLAGYFAQKKSKPDLSFPELRKESVTMEERLRPIYFCRHDAKRCFCLLFDKENNKFFAKLFLMNTGFSKKRESFNFSRELTCITKDFESVKALKKETFIIIPLSFGKWQLSMLMQAVEKPEILRTGRLIYSNGEYYLSLCIDLPEDNKIEPISFLGVSRGIEKAVNYTITDSKGQLLQNGSMSFDFTGNPSEQSRNMFKLANKITDLAVKNKSMVILQNLTGKGDKLTCNEDGKTIKPVLGCKQYNELVRIIDYKLPLKGLPEPAKVSSVDIFHRCSICGSNTRKNRFSQNRFLCTTCGFSSDLDSLGSLNLATKLLKYRNTPIKLKARRTMEGMYLQNELMGLELFVPKYENPMERLKEKIEEISASIDNYCTDMKLSVKDVKGIIEKLKSNDFTNIEIV